MTHLQEQLDELELLESMFSSPGEFEMEDKSSREQALRYLCHLTPHPPKVLSCKLNIPINAHQDSEEEDVGSECGAVGRDNENTHTISLSVRLMESYPDNLPEVYAHANDLKRLSQDQLNSDLQNFMKTIQTGEGCLLQIVEWIRDNTSGFFPVPYHTSHRLDPELGTDASPGTHFCRMWLYMHHIYSKTKRRNILSLADEFDLTGFTLPGKPGVVCVEGTVATTRDFYNTLRRWNWKSIACKRRDVQPSGDIQSLRKMTGFRELCFDTHGNRKNHMDMGQFLEYLRGNDLDYMFKELFGVEGHTTE